MVDPNKVFVTSASALAFLLYPTMGYAQSESTQAAEDDVAAVSESSGDNLIVVTGTRLRSGLTAPSPTIVSSAEQLSATSPNLISEALNQLPIFKNSSRSTNGSQSQNRDNAASFLNLRGLGKERTLVLLDSRRVVASATSGVPDINILPHDLVQRVEVVTGGASAAYGSDAVAGVVNFILDTKFTGLRASFKAGISSRGDGGIKSATLTGGSSFGGGSGHIIASGEYFKQDEIGFFSGRPRLEAMAGILPNTPGATPPNIVAAPSVFSVPAGGLIASGPLAGMQFLPGGVLAPFDFGTNNTRVSQLGGDGLYLPFSLAAGIERYSGFIRGEYTFDNDLTIYAEGSVAQSTAGYDLQQPQTGITATDFRIFSDNAFLPATVRTSLGIPTPTAPSATPTLLFTLKRISRDSGYVRSTSKSKTFRIVGGFDWDFAPNWELNGYYMHGENRFTVNVTNDPIYRRRYAAADAVFDPATGAIVCRSSLSGAEPNCIPYNLFGEGSPSAEAYAYINGTSQRFLTTKQDVASLGVRGTPFTLPAGDVNVALGVEYRREAAVQTTDSITSAPPDFTGILGTPPSLSAPGVIGGHHFNVAQPLDGVYNVKEAFVEAEVPILRDTAFFHSLSINGAARYIDYSTVGSVTTWKVGGSYEPVEGVRFRATRSRDIRAGNIEELFTGTVLFSGTVNIITTPGQPRQNVGIVGLRSGNQNLNPEIADTLTAGVVLNPSFIPGLGISVDYYDIDVSGAIAQLNPQQTVDQCEANPASVTCGLISRDLTGQFTIRTPTLNLAQLKMSGIDFEANYSTRLANGQLSLRALASRLREFNTTVPGSPPVSKVGDIGLSGTPKWSGSVLVNYQSGGLGLFLQERYIGPGKVDSTKTDAELGGNNVNAVFYTDFTLKYDIPVTRGPKLQLIATVNNLFDRQPPIAPAVPFGQYRTTNAALYDVIGRYISVGARVQF